MKRGETVKEKEKLSERERERERDDWKIMLAKSGEKEGKEEEKRKIHSFFHPGLISFLSSFLHASI